MTRKIRVLHLITSLQPGGAETNLLALMKHFEHQTVEHAVGYGGHGILEMEYAAAGVELVCLSNDPLSLRSIFQYGSMISRIKIFRPDIIHSHLDLSHLLGLLAKYSLGCKLILHIHGLGVVPVSRMLNRSKMQLFWNAVARFYRYCDRAIAICGFQIPFLEQVGIDRSKIVLVPNGINVDDSVPALVCNNADFRFVSVARFYPEKRHDLLLESFRRLVALHPHARLILVGDGPLRTEAEMQAQRLGISDRVDFLGVRRDVPDILAKSDCFILNSQWELHPITILEAMRAGLPVIASKVGGIPDTVTNDVTGLLVVPGDVADLSNAMRKMIENTETTKAMGREGRRVVLDRFSNEKVARYLEAEYKRLCLLEDDNSSDGR